MQNLYFHFHLLESYYIQIHFDFDTWEYKQPLVDEINSSGSQNDRSKLGNFQPDTITCAHSPRALVLELCDHSIKCAASSRVSRLILWNKPTMVKLPLFLWRLVRFLVAIFCVKGVKMECFLMVLKDGELSSLNSRAAGWKRHTTWYSDWQVHVLSQSARSILTSTLSVPCHVAFVLVRPHPQPCLQCLLMLNSNGG